MSDFLKVAGGKMTSSKADMTIQIAARSLEERRERIRSPQPLSLKSIEIAHVYTKETLSCAYHKRQHFEGSNMTDAIGPVPFCQPACAWSLTNKGKKELYGTKARIAGGGRTPGVNSEKAKELLRKDHEVEPVYWFSYSWPFWSDVVADFGGHLVIDCTAGDGSLALACLRLGLPYAGFVFTESHKTLLQEHLASEVLCAFRKEGDCLYSAEVAKELSDAGLPLHAHAEPASTGTESQTTAGSKGLPSGGKGGKGKKVKGKGKSSGTESHSGSGAAGSASTGASGAETMCP
eukprot:6475829-Amphidinium_carterae.3